MASKSRYSDMHQRRESIIPGSADLSNCSQYADPKCLAAILNMPLLWEGDVATPQNSLGLFQEGDYWWQPDLDQYYRTVYPIIPQGTEPTFVSIDGAVRAEQLVNFGDGKNYGFEAQLDVQLTIPLYWPNNVTNIQVHDQYYAQDRDASLYGAFFDAIDGSFCAYNDPRYVPTYPDTQTEIPDIVVNNYNGTIQCGTYKDPPPIIASAYYRHEPESVEAWPYWRRMCTEVLKLGMQGITFTSAAGDYGTAYDSNCTKFDISWSDGCPWVLSVGETSLQNGTSPDSEQVVWRTKDNYPGSSASSFSNIFERPDYQKAAVAAYFAKHDPGYPCYAGGNYNQSGYYNCDGRAFPDVAAFAGPSPIVDGGELYTYDIATSGASMLFGTVLARIVDERKKIGKGPLGVVHHVLYENPQVFKDIVKGSNGGCGGKGFVAAEGWDPPTGLGAPDYQKLLELYLSLP